MPRTNARWRKITLRSRDGSDCAWKWRIPAGHRAGDLPRLFQPFATYGKNPGNRSPASRSAKRIIEDHGGHIWARSIRARAHLFPSRSRYRIRSYQEFVGRGPRDPCLHVPSAGDQRIERESRTGLSPLAQVIHLPRQLGPVRLGVLHDICETPTIRRSTNSTRRSPPPRESGSPFQYCEGLAGGCPADLFRCSGARAGLKGIQQRLGTPEERPGDMARVVVIGHPAHQHDVPAALCRDEQELMWAGQALLTNRGAQPRSPTRHMKRRPCP